MNLVRPCRFRSTPLALAVAATLGGTLATGPVHAQSTTTTTTATATATTAAATAAAATAAAAAPVNVVVTGSAPARSVGLNENVCAGALGSASQLDTPFATSTVGATEIEDRMVTSLSQAFARDPAISSESSSYTIFSTDLFVRGLELDYQNGYKLNGMPIYGVGFDIPFDHLERVELLKGLSGFMYGFGSPGGIVNFVTKKATSQPIRNVDVDVRSNSLLTEHLDIGQRFGDDQRYGVRLNVTHEDGKTYNDGTARRDAQTLGLDARLTNDLTWTLDAMHQQRHTTGEVSVLALFSFASPTLPAPIDAANARLATPGTYNDTHLTYLSTGLQYALGNDWTIKADLGHSDVSASYVKDFSDLLNSVGDYEASLLAGKTVARYDTARAMVEGRARTGAIEHHVVAGAEHQTFTFRTASNGFYDDPTGFGNIHADNPDTYSGSTDWALYKSNDNTQTALFASDTLSLGAHWSVLAGVRDTNYVQHDYDTANAQTDAYTKNGVLTPTLALMFKPDAGSTIYTSYVESLEPGTIVSDEYVNHGQQLDPVKSRQAEVGYKVQRAGWSATAAAFRIERGAQYANADNVYVQGGRSLYRGLEASGTLQPTAALGLGGGLMWLHAQYGQGTGYDGNRVPSAPRFVADAFANYELAQLPGLSVHAGAKFIGATEGDSANDVRVDSRSTFDAGAVYATHVAGKAVSYRLQLDNLTDRKYWVSSADSQITPGMPRTVSVSAKLAF